MLTTSQLNILVPTCMASLFIISCIYVILDYNLNKWKGNYTIYTAVIIFIKCDSSQNCRLYIVVGDDNDITTLYIKAREAFLLMKHEEIQLYGWNEYYHPKNMHYQLNKPKRFNP